MGLRDHLTPLRTPNFRSFIASDVVNAGGTSMSTIALPFAVLAINESATALGIVAASFTVPFVAFMLLGGALADRLPRGPVLLVCNLVLCGAQALSAALVLTGRAQVWQLAALQFLAGIAIAIAYPAYHGMVPILLPEAERKSAYLLISQSEALLGIVGPAVAGILVATVGPGWGLAVDAMTYGVAAGLLGRLRLPFGERPDRRASLIGDMLAGWSYARGLGWVIPGGCCALVFNALISGGLGVLGPVIAHGTIGSGGFGVARAGQAVGGLITTVVLVRVVIRRPLRLCMLGFATSAVPMLVLGLGITTGGLAAGFFVMGAGMSVIGLAWSLVVQQKVREDMLSRIMAIDGFFSFVAMPVGEIVVGPLVHVFDVRVVEIGFAAVCLLVMVYGLSRRVITGVRLEPSVRVE